MIVLCDPDEDEVINAKNDLYIQENGKWIANQEILHRQMSNNTIGYYEKPTREAFHKNFIKAKTSGEPGTYNLEQALKRNPNARGLNPLTLKHADVKPHLIDLEAKVYSDREQG